VHQPHHRSDNAHGGSITSGGIKNTGADVVALLNGVHLRFHDLADQFRVGAVHHKLDPLAHEAVLNLGQLVFQKQESLPAHLVGHADDLLD